MPRPFSLDEIYQKCSPFSIAKIRESDCIGCTKCIQACPVDAIIGSAKMMHTVLENECIGCQRCVEPCPVDCIEMESSLQANYNPEKAVERYNAKLSRSTTISAHEKTKIDNRKAEILAAVARSRAKKGLK